MNTLFNIITSKEPKVWFTSDLHFGHKRAFEFMPQFRHPDIEIMDNNLIEMWNSVVNKRDTVYNLGDLSFYTKIDQTIEKIQQLNGNHILILGNHDELIERNKNKLLNMRKLDGLPLLTSIQDYKSVYVKINEQLKIKMVLSHYPIAEWDGNYKGSYMLHGHLHNKISLIEGKILNVGYDLHGRMLCAQDVYGFLNDLPNLPHHGAHLIKADQNINDLERTATNIKSALNRLNKIN